MDFSAFRQEYAKTGLRRSELCTCPFEQFGKWFQEACDANIVEPNAACLATVNAQGVPSVRTVLLKSLGTNSFIFYTNYESQKARELDANPNASFLFPWYSLERQIRITGKVQKISKEDSEAYFKSRPIGSQLGAWASRQSQEIPNREALEKEFEKVKKHFENTPTTLPPYWGGYSLKPEYFEFWQGRTNRLHDRFAYKKADKNAWTIHRLCP